MVESDGTADATRRLNVKKQTLDDAYAVPANFLEIDVVNPLTTMAAGKKRYTDYEVRMRVSKAIYERVWGRWCKGNGIAKANAKKNGDKITVIWVPAY